MPRRRSAQTMERDGQAFDLYRRGLTYRQIAAQMGYGSLASIGDAIRRASLDAARNAPGDGEALRIMLERLQDYRRQAWRVASSRHYVTTQAGRLAAGPDGAPVLDDDPVLRALDRLLRIDDHEAKLLGLYAPAKSRIEVITEDAVDAEMRRLADEIAEREQELADAGHPGTS